MKDTCTIRRISAGALLGVALSAGVICTPGAAWGWVDMSRVSHVGDTWYVTPSDDVERDCDTIQYAVDNAQPGETILLERGVFDFGEADLTLLPSEANGIIVQTADLTIKGETAAGPCDSETGEVLDWLTVIKGGGWVFELYDYANTTIEGLWLKEPYWAGIRVQRYNPVPATQYSAVIRNNRITNIKEMLYAFVEWNYGEIVCGALFLQNPRPGTYVIEGNRVEENGAYTPTEVGIYGATMDLPVPFLANRNAIFILNVRECEVMIRNNRVHGFAGNGVQVYGGWDGSCTIEDNDIHLSPSEFVRYSGIETQTALALTVTNNRIKADHGFLGCGMKIASLWTRVAPRVVTGNSIMIKSGKAAIQLGELDIGSQSPLIGAQVTDNTIKGTALYGLLFDHGNVNYVAELNTVEIPRLEKFRALEAHIYCGPLTRSNTFLVKNLEDLTIVDEGEDNVFVELD